MHLSAISDSLAAFLFRLLTPSRFPETSSDDFCFPFRFRFPYSPHFPCLTPAFAYVQPVSSLSCLPRLSASFRPPRAFFHFWPSPAFPVRTSLSALLSLRFVPLRPASPFTSPRSFSRFAFAHRQAPYRRFLRLTASLAFLFPSSARFPVCSVSLASSGDFLSLPVLSRTL